MTKNSEVKVIYIKKTKEILFRIQSDFSDIDSTLSEVGILDNHGFTSEMNSMNEHAEDIDYFAERMGRLKKDDCIELLEPRAIYEALVELALKKEKE